MRVVRIADKVDALSAKTLRRAIPLLPFGIIAVNLHQLRVVNRIPERIVAVTLYPSNLTIFVDGAEHAPAASPTLLPDHVQPRIVATVFRYCFHIMPFSPSALAESPLRLK